MNSKSETTPDGGMIYTTANGKREYDFSDSSNIIKDMNRAIVAETNKSGSARGATEWFLDAIKKGQIILPNDHDTTVSVIKQQKLTVPIKYMTLPGRMFAFVYHPKNKTILNYYDVTPLIITLPQESKETIFGLNLHYLEPDLRAELIEKMLKFSNRRLGEKDPPKGIGEFNMNYDILKTIRFVFGMPCIRSYSPDRIIGRPALIPSNQWGNAVALPCENFIKAKNRRIWIETRMKIREFIKSITSME